MRSWRRVGLSLAFSVLAGGYILILDWFVFVWHTAGEFGQIIGVKTSRSIRQVTYRECQEQELAQYRQSLEADKEARSDDRIATPLGQDLFRTSVKFTQAVRLFSRPVHSSHLAVTIEFEDGTR